MKGTLTGYEQHTDVASESIVAGVCTCEYLNSGNIDGHTPFIDFCMIGMAKPGKRMRIARDWRDKGMCPIMVQVYSEEKSSQGSNTKFSSSNPYDLYNVLMDLSGFKKVSDRDIVCFDPKCTSLMECMGIKFPSRAVNMLGDTPTGDNNISCEFQTARTSKHRSIIEFTMSIPKKKVKTVYVSRNWKSKGYPDFPIELTVIYEEHDGAGVDEQYDRTTCDEFMYTLLKLSGCINRINDLGSVTFDAGTKAALNTIGIKLPKEE